MRNPAKNKEEKQIKEARKLRRADRLSISLKVSRGRARFLLKNMGKGHN